MVAVFLMDNGGNVFDNSAILIFQEHLVKVVVCAYLHFIIINIYLFIYLFS